MAGDNASCVREPGAEFKCDGGAELLLDQMFAQDLVALRVAVTADLREHRVTRFHARHRGA